MLEEIERVKRQVEERCSEESRGLAKHLDSVREQLKEAEADRHRLGKQAVLLKEQLRESQVSVPLLLFLLCVCGPTDVVRRTGPHSAVPADAQRRVHQEHNGQVPGD